MGIFITTIYYTEAFIKSRLEHSIYNGTGTLYNYAKCQFFVMNIDKLAGRKFHVTELDQQCAQPEQPHRNCRA